MRNTQTKIQKILHSKKEPYYKNINSLDNTITIETNNMSLA